MTRRKLNIATLLLAIGLALLPAAVTAEDLNASGFAPIDEYVQAQLDDSRIPGAAIAIVQGDEIVHARGFGDSDGQEITPETPFPIGSLTKSFTALAVMQLEAAGKLTLDAPVQQYIPWFRVADADASPRITVRHLLNQTSGLSRATGITPLLEERDDTLEQYVRNLSTAELNRPVGESYEYSNANYVTLGLLIESVSGQTYGDYVQQQIFNPLGMEQSYRSHEQGRQHGMTDVHRFWFGVPVESDTPDLPAQLPTGFLVSSANDMARYLAMYLNDGTYNGAQVLPEDGIAEMHQPATNEFTRALLSTEFTARYGMGWFAGQFGEEQALWHLGELPSFNAWMVLLPEHDLAVVVLINAGSQMNLAGATEVFSRIPIGVANLLTGHEPPTGLSLTTFYAIFDSVVIAFVAIQLFALILLIRRPVRRRGLFARVRYTLPLLWEFGLGLLILFGYPALTGIGWRANFTSTPDLVVVLVIVANLWLVTGLLRLGKVGVVLADRRWGRLEQAPRERDNLPAPV